MKVYIVLRHHAYDNIESEIIAVLHNEDEALKIVNDEDKLLWSHWYEEWEVK